MHLRSHDLFIYFCVSDQTAYKWILLKTLNVALHFSVMLDIISERKRHTPASSLDKKEKWKRVQSEHWTSAAQKQRNVRLVQDMRHSLSTLPLKQPKQHLCVCLITSGWHSRVVFYTGWQKMQKTANIRRCSYKAWSWHGWTFFISISRSMSHLFLVRSRYGKCVFEHSNGWFTWGTTLKFPTDFRNVSCHMIKQM